MNAHSPESIWPFFLAPEILTEKTRFIELKADEATCEALAKLGDLPEVTHFSAKLTVDIVGTKPVYTVEGTWQARFSYRSVRSLEVFPAVLNGRVKERYQRHVGKRGTDTVIDIESSEPPLSLADEGLPIGDLLAELFMLALDPYPHMDNEPAQDWIEDEALNDDAPQQNPFARLADFNLKH